MAETIFTYCLTFLLGALCGALVVDSDGVAGTILSLVGVITLLSIGAMISKAFGF